jgi:hypothetical protein
MEESLTWVAGNLDLRRRCFGSCRGYRREGTSTSMSAAGICHGRALCESMGRQGVALAGLQVDPGLVTVRVGVGNPV